MNVRRVAVVVCWSVDSDSSLSQVSTSLPHNPFPNSSNCERSLHFMLPSWSVEGEARTWTSQVQVEGRLTQSKFQNIHQGLEMYRLEDEFQSIGY